MNWYECGIICIVALVVTIVLTPAVKKLAIKVDAVDYPGERRVNKTPIPRLGGICIFGGIVAGLIVLCLGVRFLGWQSPFVQHPDLDFNYLGVGASMILMFAVGLVDDLCDLKPRLKLLGQIVAACVAVASGLLLNSMHMPFGGSFLEFGIWAYPITVFYLVAFANIINLIDGLDGLAAGISAISAAAVFALCVMTQRPDVAMLCMVLFGACLGFLRYNFHPASIFMGDSGSLLLGYFLGCVSLMAIARSTLFVSLLVPILAAGVPVIDTFSAIIRRLRAHQPISQADSQHIHHRLLEAGFSQRDVVLLMWCWTAVLAICGVLITYTVGLPRYAIALLVAVLTVVMVAKLRLLRPVLSHRYAERPKAAEGNAGGDAGNAPGDADAGSASGEAGAACLRDAPAQAGASCADAPREGA